MKLGHLIDTIAALHTRVQSAAGCALQLLLSVRNWTIGAWVVEYEQAGEDRAAYAGGAVCTVRSLVADGPDRKSSVCGRYRAGGRQRAVPPRQRQAAQDAAARSLDQQNKTGQ